MGTAYGKHHSAFLDGILPSGIFLVSADPFNIVSPIRVIRLVVRYIQLPHNGLEPQDRIQRLKCLERMQLQLVAVPDKGIRHWPGRVRAAAASENVPLEGCCLRFPLLSSPLY